MLTMKFKCPSCKNPMGLRTGKYGDFFYCREHGTISKLAAIAISEHMHEPPLINATRVYDEKDPLLAAIKRTGCAMGHNMDDMGQLIDFFNDEETGVEWNDEHWMNTQPY